MAQKSLPLFLTIFLCESMGIPLCFAENIKINVHGSTVRVIETYPYDTSHNDLKVLGNFHITTLPVDNGTIALKADHPIIIEEHPFTDFYSRPNKFFGAQLAGQVNALLPIDRYPTQVSYDVSQQKIMETFALAGAGILRDLQSYDTKRFVVEYSGGVLDFTRVDFITKRAASLGIELIGRLSLHVGLPLQLPVGPPVDKARYVRYIKKTVERYDGDSDFGCTLPAPDCYEPGDDQFPKITTTPADWGDKHHIPYWETLKEPEPGHRNRIGNDPGLTPLQSIAVLRDSYVAIKSVAPDAEVFFAGMGPVNHPDYTEDSYLKEMLRLGALKYIDYLGFDAYVTDIQKKGAYYTDLAKAKGYNKSLWIGQIGAPHQMGKLRLPYGGTPRKQSDHVVQTYTRGLALGHKPILWGEYLDTSDQEKRKPTSWSATGLFYPGSWELKPAYFTYKLMAAALYDFKTVRNISENLYKFSFNNRSSIYIFWPKS